jgi:hypothetical protein
LGWEDWESKIPNACLFKQGLINSGIWKDLIKTKQDLKISGSFTVAIFGYFSATFRSTFWLLFDSLAEE